MRRLAGIGAAALAVAVLLTAAGCSNGDKAGGAAAKHTIVLTFGSELGSQPEQLLRFATEVAKRSNGTIQIEFMGNWRNGDPHQELDTIRDVKAGKVDLAWVGARAWDWVGVPSFDGLVAPLLVDSLPLEQKVFAAGIPRRMLAGVHRAGVIGIGVLPGPMRKALGVRRRLVRPAAFRGLVFGVQGIVAAETIRALGAHPRQVISGPSLTGLDGIEEQMSAIEGNAHDVPARYLSANLNLWPRPLVLFTSPQVFRKLSGPQREVLREAAVAAVPEAMAASKHEDAGAAHALCQRGKLAFVDLSASQLDDLRQAVAPVYRRLERDSTTRRWIRTIEALSRNTPSAPPIRCSSTSRPAGSTTETAIDGSWRMTVNKSQLTGNPAYGHPATRDDLRLDAGTYRLVLHRGRFQFWHDGPADHSHDTGTSRIQGHLVTFQITRGHDIAEIWSYRWSLYRDELTFSKPPASAPQGPPNPMFAPWHRIASSPTAHPLDGVYRQHVTAREEAKNDHVPLSQAVPENWGDFVLVIKNGHFAFTQENARACTWQYGALTVKRAQMDWRFTDGGGIAPTNAENKPGEFFVWRWSLYRGALTLNAIRPKDLSPEIWQRTSTTPSVHALSRRCPPPAKAFP
jgi:TRAP-type C4-dicarboxylate transport system substrate-binding protein